MTAVVRWEIIQGNAQKKRALQPSFRQSS